MLLGNLCWTRIASLLLACSMLALLPFGSFARESPSSIVDVRDLPAEARSTLAQIRAGGPFPYERDGVTFGNREIGRLHGWIFRKER